MSSPWHARFGAGLLAATLLVVARVAAVADDKGPGAGGSPKPAAGDAKAPEPRNLPDAEKATRLEATIKRYEDLRKNQDLVQIRTRRNDVHFLGDMRYPASAKFLRKVFDDDRDLTTCVAALVAIGKSGDFETIEYAVRRSLASVKKAPVFAASLPRMFSFVEDAKAREWIATLVPQKDADVTASVVEAVGEARMESALPVLGEILDKEKDVTVRFEAMRAYGRCGGKGAVSRLLPFLADQDWRIRMGAVEGLGYAGQPEAIAEIRKLLVRTEEPVVAETAVEAIARLGTRDAIEPLIDSLRIGRLRARQKARAALRSLAQSLFQREKDYHVDPSAWSAWWKKVKSGADPDDPAFAAAETASYFSFPIESDRVLFILDTSGSMEWPDPPRGSDIRASDWRERRIDLAHAEMFKSLRALAAQNQVRLAPKGKKNDTTDIPAIPGEDGTEPPTMFNVATFASGVTPWQKQSVLASKDNVESAIAWIQKLLPGGGTATFDAIEYGLAQRNIDTIYFLSDGVPSLGRFEERETILAEVRKLNRFKRVSISTIAMIVGISPIESQRKLEDPEDMADIMGRLASENQGRFVNASRP